MTTFDLPEGIIPPLLTPLSPDQTVDTDALRQCMDTIDLDWCREISLIGFLLWPVNKRSFDL